MQIEGSRAPALAAPDRGVFGRSAHHVLRHRALGHTHCDLLHSAAGPAARNGAHHGVAHSVHEAHFICHGEL
jgi:hypothetical protein